MASIASLHIHPIKSCRGHAVSDACLDRFGFCGDRRFLVVDEHGRFLTQRTVPALAWVNPVLEDKSLTLSAPDMPSISVATADHSEAIPFPVAIWKDTVRAVDLGTAAASWLTEFLHRPVRLVTMAPDYSRPVTKPAAQPGDQTAFSDAVPLLILSEASLEHLNGQLDKRLPMDRFRPNIVVRDCAAFAEDGWKRIQIGDVILRAAGPCTRCVIITTDQQTLERGKEPLRTLALTRRSPDGDVHFGQNYIHETKSGTLRVGMPVEILD